VVDAFPDLVVAVGAHAAAMLQELLQLVRQWIEDQRWHRQMSVAIVESPTWDETLARV
jgi:hypothetical protein